MDDERRAPVFKGWENLDTDILVKIFHDYFSLEELTSGVAHVCSGWRVACCDPVLWNTLDLSHLRSTFFRLSCYPYAYVDRFRRSDDPDLTRIMKLSLSLSKRNIRTLIFHFQLFPSDNLITYTARRCPNLRRLVLPAWNGMDETRQCSPIGFCKRLESLTMESMENPHFVFAAIKENCKKFRELKVMGHIKLFFVQNLVTLLPKLKVLSLRCTAIHQDAFVKLLDKMKRLEVLNISHSYILTDQNKKINVKDLDDSIIQKASKLKRFITCEKPETCVMCRITQIDDGNMRWFDYEEGLWKEDEVSSLRL